MSSDILKFKFIIKMIDSIELYKNKYTAISSMLKDDMAFNATLLCLLQIGETLNKIKNNYVLLNQADIKGSYNVRNFIAHDYDGIRKSVIEDILRYHLSLLKNNIIKIINNLEQEGKR